MFNTAVLFYADDGMILTNSVENAGKLVEEIVNVNRKWGLENRI